jgi:protein O-GlcNAc transferase
MTRVAVEPIADASVDAYIQQGAAQAEAGDLELATITFKAAVRIDPHYAPAHAHLADVLVRQCEPRQAGQVLVQAQLERRPSLVPTEASAEVASAFKDVVRLVEAIKHYRTALELTPDDAVIRTSLAGALRMQGHLDEAIEQFQLAITAGGGSDFARAGLADVLLTVGRVEESIEHLQHLVDTRPDLETLHSTLLLALHYGELCTPAQMVDEHRRYGRRHAATADTGWRPGVYDRDPDRRLRIGYLSPDFRNHSVAYFIEPLIEAHDRSQVEVICYAKVARPDATTRRLMARADAWRDVYGLSSPELVEAIRADRIDILVDLAGHTLGDSLCALARRTAPVQATYLGYPNCTGVPTIDYRITDRWTDPEGESDMLSTEQLVRTEGGFLCYRPPEYATPIALLPAGVDERQITFGSFNNLNKLSPQVITAWATLLKRVPRSRLVLKAAGLRYAAAREYVHERFQAQGIGAERLELAGQDAAPADHLLRYNRIDIALDTFPYNGTTTTCEALWMGVPVVTLAGRTHVSRVGVSLLSVLNMPELIADSPADYVELAVELAADSRRVVALRSDLRRRMMNSRLTDAPAAARAMEQAYRRMWRTWATSP